MFQRAMLTTAILSMTLASFGCRTSQRGVKVGGETAELKVFVNFPPHDFDASILSYHLSGCEGLEELTGTASADLSFITFKSVGLETGMSCQLRVKSLGSSDQITFTGDDNVLFWASTVKLTQDATGSLKSNLVSLIPLYQKKIAPTSESFSLSVPVVFEQAPTDDKLVAIVSCSPTLLNPSAELKPSGLKGTFHFDFALSSAEHNCTSLTIRGEEQSFSGKFATPFSFKPQNGVKTVIDEILTVSGFDNGSKLPPEDSGDIKVSTEIKECNEGEIYDLGSRECKKDGQD